MKKYFFLFSIILVFSACSASPRNSAVSPSLPAVAIPSVNQPQGSSTQTSQKASAIPPVNPTPPQTPSAKLLPPIAKALSRVTKKPFGIYVTPKNSPVSPEKFTGYHTGVDFETTSAEQNTDVKISAACAGKVLVKRYASGYGGLLVQSCALDGQAVTVVYGHMRLSSIIPNVGQTINAGDSIGVLGTGYSSETDGERKHLHFGIHKGTAVNILGYVQNQADLADWLDAQKYLQ